ncbi:histidine phosphatase family protein [bacterium D16-51]|nr:histidine phosphatase family protein [bacterium D16-59]RKI58913.1 histidine phosphatase family protein [bacterium D16-51]
MKVYMIRHGATKGNKEHRYVGVTDEPLLQESKQLLEKKQMPPVARVYASPRKRCLETAAILYPGCRPIIKESLAECDFGEFEYCNYEELNGNPYYQEFIDSMGRSGFPQGEDRDSFQKRVVKVFSEIIEEEKQYQNEDIAFVVHGGTIMAVLDFYYGIYGRQAENCCQDDHGREMNGGAEFYKWQVKNGEGYMFYVIWEKERDGFLLENLRSC